MKHLIRYRNRKIYNSETRNYVNLQELTEMLLHGMTFSVTEHDTGADCTSHILALVLVELTKISNVSTSALFALIQNELDKTQQKAVQ